MMVPCPATVTWQQGIQTEGSRVTEKRIPPHTDVRLGHWPTVSGAILTTSDS